MKLVLIFLNGFEEMDLEFTFAIEFMLAHHWDKIILVRKHAIGNVSDPA